jgi:putative CocE/NonD family hydrolase
MASGAGTEHARTNQYLIAGPWVHIPWGDMAGDQNFGADALLDTDAILLRWFNHWLKDSGEFRGEPKIRHFSLGTNRWHEAESWKAGATLDLYLHSQERANSRKGTGVLAATPPLREEPRDVFIYDPEVPVYGPGGPSSLSGPTNQAAVELGNNLLVYTSAPLETPLHLFGHPEVEIYCITSAGCADFAVKLVRVTPHGRAEFVCIGIARSTYLFPPPSYSADDIHCWRFALEPTSCVILSGESIRIEIAGSAFPLYDRNPSMTEVHPAVADSWNWKRSTHSVLHQPGYASLLRLPVIPVVA